jgi:1-deoxy-D-xylulose 5-phosphate reductoisomerase
MKVLNVINYALTGLIGLGSMFIALKTGNSVLLAIVSAIVFVGFCIQDKERG